MSSDIYTINQPSSRFAGIRKDSPHLGKTFCKAESSLRHSIWSHRGHIEGVNPRRKYAFVTLAQKWGEWKSNPSGQWRDWKGKQKQWGNPTKLQREAQRNLLKPTSAFPILAGLAVAGMFGPLIFTIAASALGLAFATVAGATAIALFLPAAIFIGGTVAAFSVLGSIFSLLGVVPLVAIAWTFYNRSGKAKVLTAEREAAIKRDEWQAKEYRRQQEEIELLQSQEQELEDFDKRLRSR